MERKIKIIIEYDGTNFAGWQSQKNARSVQDAIQNAAEKLFNERIKIYGAGRTDSGVHAIGQVAHFITSNPIASEKITSGLNAYLPEDVAILSAEEVPMEFDARRSAIQRQYRYVICNRNVRPVMQRRFSAHIPYQLNFDLISQALEMLRGEHNFSAFRSVGCTAKRTILNLETAVMKKEMDYLIFDFKCRSFLYNMVRIIVGLLIDIGREKISLSIIEKMFKTKQRSVNIFIAPPQGLTLVSVLYLSDFAKNKIK